MPQLPSQLPDASGLLQSISSSTAAAGGAVQGLAHAPQDAVQQLQRAALQLQELGSSSSTLEPHFGSQAVLQALQELGAALSGTLQRVAATLSIEPGSANAAAAGDRLAAFSSSIAGGRSISSSISSSMGGFAGAGATAQASLDALSASWQAVAASVSASLPTEVGSSLEGVQQQAAALAASMQAVQGTLAQLAHTLQQLPETGQGGYSFATLCFVGAGALAAVAASAPSAGSVFDGSGGASDTLTHDYDPAAAEAHFRRRPVLVAHRSLQLAAEMARFGLSLLGDVATNKLQVNEVARAEQLRGAIERLGPAYVKVAQALSTRVDLLSPAYFTQIQLLQDRVPPFPCDQALKVRVCALERYQGCLAAAAAA
jgi:aarF domain-containing kinase